MEGLPILVYHGGIAPAMRFTEVNSHKSFNHACYGHIFAWRLVMLILAHKQQMTIDLLKKRKDIRRDQA